MNEEKQMDGARLSVTDHKQREKEDKKGRNEKIWREGSRGRGDKDKGIRRERNKGFTEDGA